ncbi:MAG TPA: IclR family transcriptional regulator [Rhodospirillales bacterium]|jgi:DNA-binding IclR family transcriptional regulator|nr:IclR family transcriptional regulator [Rhodospirillales bacterium]
MADKGPHSSILSKSVLVLETLGKANGAVRYTDLVAQTKLSKSTAHRILSILTSEGMVHYDEHTKTYRLGMRIMEWAAHIWRDFNLREVSLEEMRMLNAETGENINLAIRDNLDIIYMNRVESFKPVRAVATLGARASIHCTGLGKALTAHLPEEEQSEIAHALKYEKMTDHTIENAETFLTRLEETRRHGYGMDDCEFRDEIRCIAAPIFDFRGLPVGALSISTLVFRVPKDTLLSWAPNLIAAAKSISQKIGYIDEN